GAGSAGAAVPTNGAGRFDRCPCASESAEAALATPLGGGAGSAGAAVPNNGAGRLDRCPCTSESAEDGEGVAGSGLPDELPSRLDLTVELAGELLGGLAGRRPGDHVRPAADDAVAVGLEAKCELLRLGVRPAGDADLPRCVAVPGGLLLDRLGRRLVVPAVLRLEPVLAPDELWVEVELRELGLDRGHRLVEL